MAWERCLYALGLRVSRLAHLNPRPDARYRAVVVGLPREYWDSFDAAYPEFDKLFAEPDVLAGELRLALQARHVALILCPEANRRRALHATKGRSTTIFEAGPAPIPLLERDGELAFGYWLDSMDHWVTARRPTELSLILEHFDLAGRHAMGRMGWEMAERTALAPIGSGPCLHIPDDAGDPAPTDVAGPVVRFDDHLDMPWYAPEVQRNLMAALVHAPCVIVHHSPLGVLALLAGRKVIVTGKPAWAGYGLTEDRATIRRVRTLSRDEFAAVLFGVLARYVDESGEPVDPAEGWVLPGQSPAPPRSAAPAAHG
jgi:hypothetical protein